MIGRDPLGKVQWWCSAGPEPHPSQRCAVCGVMHQHAAPVANVSPAPLVSITVSICRVGMQGYSVGGGWGMTENKLGAERAKRT